MVAAAPLSRCARASAAIVSVRISGASPGRRIANFARDEIARRATSIAWPVPRCGSCNTVLDAERRHSGGYVIGLVPHDRNDLARLERLAGAHHVLDECPPARAVQHLRQCGFQPRALARCQNHNHEVGICHACILSVSRGIDNAGERRAMRIEYFIERTQGGTSKDEFNPRRRRQPRRGAGNGPKGLPRTSRSRAKDRPAGA